MKQISNPLHKLSLTVVAVAIVIFSVQAIITNLVSPAETATALSITSITANSGSIDGGNLVTITGDFDIPHTPTDIVQISAGSHSLALTRDNQIFAWGNNFNGRLGDGTLVHRSTPVSVDMTGVLAGKNISRVFAANTYSLALSAEGRVYGWGDGENEQLGNSTNTLNNPFPVAVDTTGALAGKTITQISAGFSQVLALSSDGGLYAWGGIFSPSTPGSLGDGTWSSSNIPVAVDMSGVLSNRTITQISAGAWHSLALDDQGNVFAWGGNSLGQLGNGTNIDSNIPIAIDLSNVLASGETITSIAASRTASFALSNRGNLYAWGDNSSGQLGNVTNTDSNLPISAGNLGALTNRTIVQIFIGSSDYVIAQDYEGNFYTWGNGAFGQLGNGTIGQNSNIPVAVYSSSALAGRNITQVAAGSLHALVLDSTIWLTSPTEPQQSKSARPYTPSISNQINQQGRWKRL